MWLLLFHSAALLLLQLLLESSTDRLLLHSSMLLLLLLLHPSKPVYLRTVLFCYFFTFLLLPHAPLLFYPSTKVEGEAVAKGKRLIGIMEDKKIEM